MNRVVLMAVDGEALMIPSALQGQTSLWRDFAETVADVIEDGWTPVVTVDSDQSPGLETGFVAAITSSLRARRLDAQVIAALIHPVVDIDDPAFITPTKPIGSRMDAQTARRHVVEDGWDVDEGEPGSFRRVVPSPEPLQVLESEVIRTLVKADVVVVASGGGIPVTPVSYTHLTLPTKRIV